MTAGETEGKFIFPGPGIPIIIVHLRFLEAVLPLNIVIKTLLISIITSCPVLFLFLFLFFISS